MGIRMLYLNYKLQVLWEKEKNTPWWTMQAHDHFDPAVSEEFKAIRRRMHQSVLVFFALLVVTWLVIASMHASGITFPRKH
jgi:hypothetical protein